MDVRRDSRIQELNSLLSLCAVYATGAAECDQQAIVGILQITPESVPEYVRDRISDLELQVSQHDRAADKIRKLSAELEKMSRRGVDPELIEWIRESIE